jgi:hypothetical protein
MITHPLIGRCASPPTSKPLINLYGKSQDAATDRWPTAAAALTIEGIGRLTPYPESRLDRVTRLPYR